MSNFFDMDGGVMGTLSKITDVIFVSILFIIFSLPVITMGASFTALYYTTVKSIRRGRSYIFQSFWKSFKSNFKDATILWLLVLAVFSLLGVNLWFTSHMMSGTFAFVLACIYIMMAFTIFIAVVYLFPLLSRFSISKKNLLSTTFLIAIKHLPFSLLMALICLLSALAAYLIPLLMFVMPGVGALILSFPMERVLKKYTPTSQDETKDAWYLE